MIGQRLEAKFYISWRCAIDIGAVQKQSALHVNCLKTMGICGCFVATLKPWFLDERYNIL